jgi:hypothetical protein
MPRWAKLRLRPGRPPVLVKRKPAKRPPGRPRKPEVYIVKRPRGRPRSPGGVTPPVAVRIPHGVVTQVDAVAQARGIDRSKAIVLLLKAGLEANNRKANERNRGATSRLDPEVASTAQRERPVLASSSGPARTPWRRQP